MGYTSILSQVRKNNCRQREAVVSINMESWRKKPPICYI